MQSQASSKISKEKQILHIPNHEQIKIISKYINEKSKRFAQIIFAPPGCGKTFIGKSIVHKLINQKGVPWNNILFLTFNRPLSEDINNSLKALGASKISIAHTISSLALRIICKMSEDDRYQKYKPLQEQSAKTMLKNIIANNKVNIMIQLDIRATDLMQDNQQDEQKQLKRQVRRIFSLITDLHSNNKTLDKYQEQKIARKPLSKKQLFDLKIAELYLEQAQKKMIDKFQLTFDHMVCKAITQVRSATFQAMDRLPNQCFCQCIIVDEFQDLNKAQLDLLLCLVEKMPNRRFLFMGDPDQNIYEWRYANYKNFQQFEEKIEDKFRFEIKKDGLQINHRLHQKMIDISQKLINFEHQQINYKQIRQNILRNVSNYQNIITVSTEKDQQIIIEQYSNQFDQIGSIIQRIYKLNKKGVQYKKMTILLRSLNFSYQFDKKFIFAVKNFQKQKKDKGEIVKIPFLILKNKNIFESSESIFIIRCFQYFYYIKKNSQQLKPEKKKKIINKILLSIKGITRTNNYVKRMTQQNELSLDLILDDKKFEQCKRFYEKKGSNQQKQKGKIYSQFRQKFNKFLLRCQQKQESFFSLTNFLIESFYDQDSMELKVNEAVQSLLQYLEGYPEEDNVSKCWKVFFQNIRASCQDLKQQDLPNKVIIQTLHKSKGRTYQTVFLPFMNGNLQWLGGEDEQNLPYTKTDNRSDLAQRNEQLRLYYTGITRTKGSLYVSRTLKRIDDPKREFLFLKELIKNLKKIPSTKRAQQQNQAYYKDKDKKGEKEKAIKTSQSTSKRNRRQNLEQDKEKSRKKVRVNNNGLLTFISLKKQEEKESQKHENQNQHLVKNSYQNDKSQKYGKEKKQE